jgi:hypothetical protein
LKNELEKDERDTKNDEDDIPEPEAPGEKAEK